MGGATNDRISENLYRTKKTVCCDQFENFGAVLRGISRFSKNEPELRAARR